MNSLTGSTSRDAGSIERTSTFIPNIFIEKYQNWHTTNTSTLLYKNFAVGVLKSSLKKVLNLFCS
jgi:hypothetical protein